MNENVKYFEPQLFNHNILLGKEKGENQVEVAFALTNKFGIVIQKGLEHADLETFKSAAQFFPSVPSPFYKGFPTSVRRLTPDEILFDKLYNYYQSYELGNFDEQLYSVLETEIERTALKENTKPKYFSILTENEAVEKLFEFTEDLLQSTRPLNESNLQFIFDIIEKFDYKIKNCKSHDTAMRLFEKTQDTYYLKFLNLNDCLKLTEQLNYKDYISKTTTSRYYRINKAPEPKLTKLNLRNKSRKLITKFLNKKLPNVSFKEIEEAYERKQIWSGLLHHIHYQTNEPKAQDFLNKMRGKGNQSALSTFEKKMNSESAVEAAKFILNKKGASIVLRKLNYLLSRCKNETEIEEILSMLDCANNPIVIIQLIQQYSNYKTNKRVFKFVKNFKVKKHNESDEEFTKRQTILPESTVKIVSEKLLEMLKNIYKGKIKEKVYIDPEMAKIAIPLQESTGSVGQGVLPKGSKVSFNDSNIRFFTYWEKVNDIDLSLIGLTDDGETVEFSWRTFGRGSGKFASGSIEFSGDCTTGYKGGSEYFDIDFDKLKSYNSKLKYLILSDNVYSDGTFKDCVCRAGFMSRKDLDAGQIFEPKTVGTQFIINAEANYASLFVVDIAAREIIWLNIANSIYSNVAGTNGQEWLLDYINITKIFNVKNIVSMMSENMVDSPDDAEIIFSDNDELAKDKTDIKRIHSYDVEYILKLINN